MDIQTYYVMTLPGTEYFKGGGSGKLYTYPNCTTEVIKLPFSSKASTANLEIEKRVYQRLGSHPNIIRCLRIEDYGIHLERAEHCSIREYYAEGGTATLEERIKWSRDVANALQYIHEHNVRHADLGGKNVLLDSSRTVRLCDFAGSAIDDNRSTVWAQSGYRHPDDDEVEHSTIRAELHALGSTIFEIITSSQPHGKVEEWIVAQWIREGKYPDINNIALGDMIMKCWKGVFKSAKEVAQDIEDRGKQFIKFISFSSLLT
ncbi:kinase-like domain-containing protein [Hypoxylon argillaceum]|nr:kinase-like domain-containing protein [Hypoxylon argillaceum]